MSQITIEFTAEQEARLVHAWEVVYGTRATMDEVKRQLVQNLKDIVRNAERRAFRETPFDPS